MSASGYYRSGLQGYSFVIIADADHFLRLSVAGRAGASGILDFLSAGQTETAMATGHKSNLKALTLARGTNLVARASLKTVTTTATRRSLDGRTLLRLS